MTCPRCGAKIEEGKLLCSRCGCEIKYVPDFEPEIESRISETLSSVAANMQWEEDEDDEKEEFTRISKDDRTDYTGYSDELKTKKKVNSEVISMEEFTEENGFDKLSFSVFREGMTFINIETNRENKSIAKIITKTILDDNDDVDELYVRNIKEKKDIELIFHDCSYLDWLKEERD